MVVSSFRRIKILSLSELVLTNKKAWVDEMKAITALGGSDYVILEFKELQKNKHIHTHALDFKRAISSLGEALIKILWAEIPRPKGMQGN